jgi:hypothetical protein
MKNIILQLIIFIFSGTVTAAILFFVFLIHSFDADLHKQQSHIEAVRPLPKQSQIYFEEVVQTLQ